MVDGLFGRMCVLVTIKLKVTVFFWYLHAKTEKKIIFISYYFILIFTDRIFIITA